MLLIITWWGPKGHLSVQHPRSSGRDMVWEEGARFGRKVQCCCLSFHPEQGWDLSDGFRNQPVSPK